MPRFYQLQKQDLFQTFILVPRDLYEIPDTLTPDKIASMLYDYVLKCYRAKQIFAFYASTGIKIGRYRQAFFPFYKIPAAPITPPGHVNTFKPFPGARMASEADLNLFYKIHPYPSTLDELYTLHDRLAILKRFFARFKRDSATINVESDFTAAESVRVEKTASSKKTSKRDNAKNRK